jgi:hypothetical protein
VGTTGFGTSSTRLCHAIAGQMLIEVSHNRAQNFANFQVPQLAVAHINQRQVPCEIQSFVHIIAQQKPEVFVGNSIKGVLVLVYEYNAKKFGDSTSNGNYSARSKILSLKYLEEAHN